MSTTPPTETDDDDLIWHYTNAEGLYGIIGQAKRDHLIMHCTNILFMNDSQEFFHGFNLIKSHLEKFNKQSHTEKVLSEFINVITNSNQYYKYSPHAISFCNGKNSGDRLSQWRGYCSKGGFSVGLLKKDVSSHSALIEMDYIDEGNRDQKVSELINILTNPLNAEEFALKTVMFIAACKHKSFEEEQEMRALCNAKSEVNFKISNGILKPYKELKVPKTALKRIIIGPSPKMDLCELGLNMFLKAQELENVTVTRSSIPYRTHH